MHTVAMSGFGSGYQGLMIDIYHDRLPADLLYSLLGVNGVKCFTVRGARVHIALEEGAAKDISLKIGVAAKAFDILCEAAAVAPRDVKLWVHDRQGRGRLAAEQIDAINRAIRSASESVGPVTSVGVEYVEERGSAYWLRTP